MRPLGQMCVIQKEAPPGLGSQAGPWPVITSAVQLCDPKVQVVVRDEIAMGLSQLNDRPGGRALAQLNLQGLAPADEGEKAVELATGHSLRRSAERRGLTSCKSALLACLRKNTSWNAGLGSLTVHCRLLPEAVLVLGGTAAQARPCSTFRTGERTMPASSSGGDRSGARNPAWRSNQQDRLLLSPVMAERECQDAAEITFPKDARTKTQYLRSLTQHLT